MLWSSVSERLEDINVHTCVLIYIHISVSAVNSSAQADTGEEQLWPRCVHNITCAAAPIKFKAWAQKLCAVWIGLNWSIKLPSLLAVCRINRCILKVAAEVIYSALVTTDRQIQLQHSGLHTRGAGNWRMCWWRLFQIAALTKCVTRLSIKMTKPEATRTVI